MFESTKVERIFYERVDYLESKKEEIFKIIPELKPADGFDQRSSWHIYDVWKHTEVALSNSNYDLEERLALLLHDIGKPFSYIDENIALIRKLLNIQYCD